MGPRRMRAGPLESGDRIMKAQRNEQLQATIETYDLLASLFLTLPDEALVESIVAGTFEEGSRSAGIAEIARFGRAQANRDLQDILIDIARDRVRLMRGVNQEGIEPPYESLYVKQQANASIGSLNRFYADFGYSVDEGVKDAPDQLGVELAFAKLVLESELEAVERGDDAQAAEYETLYNSFLSQHLGRWASAYAAQMAAAAETGFYRGIALLIEELLP